MNATLKIPCAWLHRRSKKAQTEAGLEQPCLQSPVSFTSFLSWPLSNPSWCHPVSQWSYSPTRFESIHRRSSDNTFICPNPTGAAVQAWSAAAQMWTQMRGRMDEQDFVLTEPLGLGLQSLARCVFRSSKFFMLKENTGLSLKWLHVWFLC